MYIQIIVTSLRNFLLSQSIENGQLTKKVVQQASWWQITFNPKPRRFQTQDREHRTNVDGAKLRKLFFLLLEIINHCVCVYCVLLYTVLCSVADKQQFLTNFMTVRCYVVKCLMHKEIFIILLQTHG